MRGRVCISAGQSGGLESEVSARIAALGLDPVLLPDGGSTASRQSTLAGCAMLISLYPADAAANLCLGLAGGMGLPIFVLAANREIEPFPRGARVFTSLQALVDAIPTGDKGRHVDEPLLSRLGACREGVDWYLRRYPGGRHSSEWTPEEQRQSLADGGAPWLKTAFDYRLIPLHAMDGADFTGADLAGLRLRSASLKNAKCPGADISGAQLTATSLAGADLSAANLSEAALRRCDLTGADATGALFKSAVLDHCLLNSLIGNRIRLDQARIRETTADGAVLRGAVLAGGGFEDVVFSNVDLTGADLSGARFQACSFAGAVFTAAKLEGAVFSGCDLTSANRDGAAFDTAYVQP